MFEKLHFDIHTKKSVEQYNDREIDQRINTPTDPDHARQCRRDIRLPHYNSQPDPEDRPDEGADQTDTPIIVP